MKYIEILNLADALSKLNLPGVKFAYAVAKNLNILKVEVQALETARKTTEDYNKFDKERIALATKHAKKDDNGKPIVVGQNFEIENMEEFEYELAVLKEKHKEAIEKREAQLKDFEDLLQKEVEIKLHKIALEDVPQSITTKQMTDIYSLIEE